MSFYRSLSVKHYKLILPRDYAEQIMNHIGQANLIHIEPLDVPILDRPFLRQVKRCGDCLMRISEIETILQQRSILYTRSQFTQQICMPLSKEYTQLFDYWSNFSQAGTLSLTHVLDFVQREVEHIWNFYRQSIKRFQEIKSKINFIRQNLAIIKAGEKQFGPSFFTDTNQKFDSLNLQFEGIESHQVHMKTGIIKRKDQLQLKRTVFRISKNNCFVTVMPYSAAFDKLQEGDEQKSVFFLLFSALKGGVLDKKLNRLVCGFSAQNYYLPQNVRDLNKHKELLEAELVENENLLKLNENQFQDNLAQATELLPGRSFSRFEAYKLYLIKEKELYAQLNQMRVYNNFLQSSVYVCQKDISSLQNCLKDIEDRLNYPSGQLIETVEGSPPTVYPFNLYTHSAQLIVETYGVPNYKQANPAFFTTVTFPFLFGVMFGDIAHGLLILLFGLYLSFYSARNPSEIGKILLPHRYMIVLMGFFSTYCGLIYNDFMSISLNMFGSCYKVGSAAVGLPIERLSSECVYPFGVDPVWSVATNSLNFIDSLKMKVSVIIGVFHMTVGVLLKGSNSLYFRSKLSFLFQFLPQLIFMTALFGYMDFLIVFKWLIHWQPYDANAPSIITTMINLPLKLGKTENCCGGQPLWGTAQQTSQNTIQFWLLIAAATCVPIMLLPKPLIQVYKKRGQQEDLAEQELTEQREQLPYIINANQKEESCSEIFVNQFIETIQYVLGSISNTASYLRLWALSLAHSQLSEVFFQKTVESGIAAGFSGIHKMIFGFPLLAGATFGVLICMDSMECFLHTLRLHWVQFQNKFYKGNGRAFKPFNFQTKLAFELKK